MYGERRILPAAAIGLVLIGAPLVLAGDTAGTLDATFGDDGVVITIMNPHGITRDIPVQSDDKIVAAGSSDEGGAPYDDGQWLVCYETDGELDTSFGTNGVFTYEYEGLGDAVGGPVALYGTDGGIVVSVDLLSGTTDADVSVFRLDAYGALDATFGVGCMASAGGDADDDDSGYAMAVDSDGDIVVDGWSGTGNYSLSWPLARYCGGCGLRAQTPRSIR